MGSLPVSFGQQLIPLGNIAESRQEYLARFATKQRSCGKKRMDRFASDSLFQEDAFQSWRALAGHPIKAQDHVLFVRFQESQRPGTEGPARFTAVGRLVPVP